MSNHIALLWGWNYPSMSLTPSQFCWSFLVKEAMDVNIFLCMCRQKTLKYHWSISLSWVARNMAGRLRNMSPCGDYRERFINNFFCSNLYYQEVGCPYLDWHLFSCMKWKLNLRRVSDGFPDCICKFTWLWLLCIMDQEAILIMLWAFKSKSSTF